MLIQWFKNIFIIIVETNWAVVFKIQSFEFYIDNQFTHI